MRKYDIFISYRREGGAETAKHLRDVLVGKGYRVFFDTDSLGAVNFNKELLKVIKECTDFIIILSEGALDRCTNDEDWVRQELVCALQNGKNIIPVIHPNFTFPEVLPDDINDIRWKNGIQVNTQYFDAVVQKIISFLKTKSIVVFAKQFWLPAVIVVAAIAVIVLGAYKMADVKHGMDVFPTTAEETDILNESIGFAVSNLKYADNAFYYYDSALEEAVQFCENEATAKSKQDVLADLILYEGMIQKEKEQLYELDDSLSDKLTKTTALETAEFKQMPKGLYDFLGETQDRLELVYWLIDQSGFDKKTVAEYCGILQEESKLTEEACLVSLNQMFASCEPEALVTMKTEYTPLFKTVYELNYTWNDDVDDLKMREETIWTQLNPISARIASLFDMQRREIDKMSK